MPTRQLFTIWLSQFSGNWIPTVLYTTSSNRNIFSSKIYNLRFEILNCGFKTLTVNYKKNSELELCRADVIILAIRLSFISVYYRNDLNTGNIQKPDFIVYNIQMFFKMVAILTNIHLNRRPYKDQTNFYNLNARIVKYSDHYRGAQILTFENRTLQSSVFECLELEWPIP